MTRVTHGLSRQDAAMKTGWKRVTLAVLLVPTILAVLVVSSGCTVIASDGGHGGHGHPGHR